MSQETESLRIDKWLWAARFFKTRSLAGDAVAGGKVHLNQQRCKPSKEIKPGDKLTINKEGLTWDITVSLVSAQRRSAKEAVLLYEESPESKTKREQQMQLLKEQRQLNAMNGIDHKPNKKERRLIHRFIRAT